MRKRNRENQNKERVRLVLQQDFDESDDEPEVTLPEGYEEFVDSRCRNEEPATEEERRRAEIRAEEERERAEEERRRAELARRRWEGLEAPTCPFGVPRHLDGPNYDQSCLDRENAKSSL